MGTMDWDIKKIIAYSTLSNLGLMVCFIGMGNGDGGFVHLIVHACFKALLFIAAGLLIHKTHEQDLRSLRGS